MRFCYLSFIEACPPPELAFALVTGTHASVTAGPYLVKQQHGAIWRSIVFIFKAFDGFLEKSSLKRFKKNNDRVASRISLMT